MLERKPRELSGGQRQRVAVGRAIVRDPQVFLFDEPLSNLDAKLRIQMRVELGELHKRLGATIVYVTHDQVEAMTLGERIVVMNKGVIQQVASPTELYANPKNMFVAGFIGSPAMNFIDARIEQGRVVIDGAEFLLSEDAAKPVCRAITTGRLFLASARSISTVMTSHREFLQNIKCRRILR